MVPQARTIAYLRTGPQLSSTATEQSTADALTTARTLGRQVLVLKVDSAPEVNAAFSTRVNEHADALVIASSPFFDTVEINDQLAALTLRNAMPTIYQQR